MSDRTLTVAEVAAETGLTAKAVRRRIERGTLRSVLRDGARHVPRSELGRAGLLRGREPAPEGHDPAGVPLSGADMFRELLDTVERQAGQIAEQRQLASQAESLRVVADQERARADELQAQVLELTARLTAAEQRPRRRWFTRAPA